VYVIIRTGGKQYRVTPGETLRVERLEQPVGSVVEFPVLAVRDDSGLRAGAALAPARVRATVTGHGRHRKVLVFKYKKTNQYKITRGHRQHFTTVRIDEIVPGGN
jgi:large subunit ribosomal protein L21